MNTVKTAALAGVLALWASNALAATYSATGLDIVVDQAEDSVSFAVTEPGVVSSLTVTLGISTCGEDFEVDGTCEDGFQSTYNEELYLQLVSAAGTVVDLVETFTFSGQDGGISAELTFDDAAADVGGAEITSGTFSPVDALSSVFGELAAGTWTIIIGDDVALDPKRLDSYSVTINGVQAVQAVPLPAGLPLLLLGLGGLGLASRMRRAA